MNTTEPMAPHRGVAPIPSPIQSGIQEAAPETAVRTGTYELMIIVPGTVADGDVPAVKAEIAKVITGTGATISEEEDLEKRKLAFPIKHIRQGFYHSYKLEAPKQSIKKLDEALHLRSDVLRHLLTIRTVKTKEQLEAETALRERIMAKRAAAEEREVADRHVKEAKEVAEREVIEKQPTREVTKEELDKKLEEILTDENLGQ